jgi:hypothetical protein
MPWGATFDVPAPIENYDETVPLVEEITHGVPEGMIGDDRPLRYFHRERLPGHRDLAVGGPLEEFPDRRATPLLQRLTGQDEPEQPDPQPFPVHAVRARSTDP